MLIISRPGYTRAAQELAWANRVVLYGEHDAVLAAVGAPPMCFFAVIAGPLQPPGPLAGHQVILVQNIHRLPDPIIDVHADERRTAVHDPPQDQSVMRVDQSNTIS
ncbi:hypothetical protein [Deinococcus humi]|uniref:Uncharacterized protein n=1 Tax=Deinococcus humi TaxID=662880 RepID=A0A7W8NIU2_9DEIO|nr:hypothetical protein [Deinococcus humi]MBB5366193.1 hypothetical protein [Deinococcus humi]GGO40812.1 hypothetical protein GCM10008949_50740 [Deinococcus humi]